MRLSLQVYFCVFGWYPHLFPEHWGPQKSRSSGPSLPHGNSSVRQNRKVWIPRPIHHIPQLNLKGGTGECKSLQKKIENGLYQKPKKQLQRFLGFTNFYRRFIKDFSKIANPLNSLTSTKISFQWTPEAYQAFHTLKERFSQAPILFHPDPTCQFILEVDASDTVVGAILSPRSPKIRSCIPVHFFSRSSLQLKETMTWRELLSIKLALEEWRYWLEGPELPVIVWTDHQNLSYIQSAKLFNPKQLS